MRISVVIPVHDEESLLPRVGPAIVRDLRGMAGPAELLLVDNGSRDRTAQRLQELIREGGDGVRAFFLPERDYGAALKKGLSQARGRVRAIMDLDMWRAEFLRKAIERISAGAAIVVGGKEPALDRRPGLRRLATAVHSRILGRVFPELKGLDCHGALALDWGRCAAVFARCELAGDAFKPEFLIRAARGGLPIVLEPVSSDELRPARTSLAARTLNYLPNLWRLRRLLAAEAPRKP